LILTFMAVWFGCCRGWLLLAERSAMLGAGYRLRERCPAALDQSIN